MTNWSEISAYFGGAFDPPHLGHREAVEALFKNPGLKEVFILPTGTPSMKTARTEAGHRLEMARLNFRSLQNPSGSPVSIDDREVRRKGDQFSYTYDSLLEIRQERGISEGQIAPIAFIIGVDQVLKLDQWHRFPEILGLCHWVALERAPGGASEMRQALQRLEALGVLRSTGKDRLFETRPGKGPSTSFLAVPTPARAVSSTEIRRQFALMPAGVKSSENHTDLDFDVESYLKANALYGT